MIIKNPFILWVIYFHDFCKNKSHKKTKISENEVSKFYLMMQARMLTKIHHYEIVCHGQNAKKATNKKQVYSFLKTRRVWTNTAGLAKTATPVWKKSVPMVEWLTPAMAAVFWLWILEVYIFLHSFLMLHIFSSKSWSLSLAYMTTLSQWFINTYSKISLKVLYPWVSNFLWRVARHSPFSFVQETKVSQPRWLPLIIK